MRCACTLSCPQKHPQFIEKLETLGVKYIRTIPEDV
jgi:hypothetical protein